MGNLRDRLKRIHEIKKEPVNSLKAGDHLDLLNLGWNSCGFNVLCREVDLPTSFKKIKSLPSELPILVPDLKYKELPGIEDFLFFDLETTGLSGGAGTVAFLAAFGKIQNGRLKVTQYLLLDYPGENDFLEKTLLKLNAENSVIVSYNGKTFDSQIIKTRCLMNRMKIPVYRHVDLLHPSRRLWKKNIQDCSQTSIETKILGIFRDGDIPGALAPEIWFEFLKTGNTERLMGICDHNLSDISGLSEIFYAVIQIARDLFSADKYNYNIERLALSVYAFAYRQMTIGNYGKPLELINKAIEAMEPGTFLYNKLMRRKNRLEKLTAKNSS